MATVMNPDGTVSEFKIGQDESETVAVVPVKGVKLKKDGTPRKKMGPAKKFDYERKTISAQIHVDDYNALVNMFGKPTDAINALVKLWKDKQ